MSDWIPGIGPYRNRPSQEVRDAEGNIVGRVFLDWPAKGQHIYEPLPASEACKVGNDGWVTVNGRKEPLVGRIFEPQAWGCDPSSRFGKLVVSGEGDDEKSIGWVMTGKDASTSFVPFGNGDTAHIDPDGTVRSGPHDSKNDFKQPVVGKSTPLPQPKPDAEPAPEPKPEPANTLKNGSWPRVLIGVGLGLASIGLALATLFGHVIDRGSSAHAPSATPTEQPSGQPITASALGNDARQPAVVTSTTTAGAARQPPVVVTPATPMTTVPAPAGPTTTLPKPTPVPAPVVTPTTRLRQPIVTTTTMPASEPVTPATVITLQPVPAHLPGIGNRLGPVAPLPTP